MTRYALRRRRPTLAHAPLAVAVACVLVQLGALLVPHSAPFAVRLVAGATATATSVAALHRRSRTPSAEQQVWRWLAVGWGLLGTGGMVTACAGAVPRLQPYAQVPMLLATVLAFPLLYRALVRWTRHNPSHADPEDVLNGVSATLVVTALLLTAQTWAGAVGPGAGGPGAVGPGAVGRGALWGDLLTVAQFSALLVLVLSAATAARLSPLRRDPRMWVMTAGLLLVCGVALTAQLTAGPLPEWGEPLWTLGILCPAVAALLPVRSAPVQAADPVASTVGAFVVVVAAALVVLAGTVTGVSPAVAALGVAAVLGSSTRLLINVRDLDQLSTSRREALTDDLTGTANRRAVVRALEAAVADGRAVLLAVLDVDRFKEVNDALGHGAGDDLLRMIAQRVRPVLGPQQVFGRLGGDEFAVVCLGDPEAAAAGQAAARLSGRLLSVFAEAFPLTGMSVHADVSIGLTSWHPGGPAAAPDAATMLRQADAAMYDAKRTRVGVLAYDQARHGDTGGLLALAQDLRSAVSTGRLVLHYQPQLSVRTGDVIGVEALVRWQHPVLGLLGPDRFVPLAEAHGLMGAVTGDVLEQAVRQLAAWRGDGLHLRMSVNLSASDLLDAGLPERVRSLLHRHDVPGAALVLEVTETVLLREPERSVAVVGALRALGAGVSIDDFGTGYSSLAQLRRLPVDELKLDRSFTTDLLDDTRAAAIVASTIRLAHELGLRVVAEGVEDTTTLQRLVALGCDESQGYLHSRPLPAGPLVEWLHRHRAASTAGVT